MVLTVSMFCSLNESKKGRLSTTKTWCPGGRQFLTYVLPRGSPLFPPVARSVYRIADSGRKCKYFLLYARCFRLTHYCSRVAQTATDFADASHSKSAKSAATTISYGIFSSENAYPCTVTKLSFRSAVIS